MRDLVILNPTGVGAVRKFLLFFAMLFVSLFATSAIPAQTALAAPATWNDGEIKYEGNTYTRYGGGIAEKTADMPKGAQLYTYASDSDRDKTPPKIHIIWFEPGADPTNATSAHYGYYSQVDDAAFEGPDNKATVEFTNAGESDQAGQDAETTSCIVDGIGWIVCPISNFLSSAMDTLFGILQSFLTVQPISGDVNSPMYRGWEIIRNFANIAFIIAFLVIIYSQLTSIGLSNYGIKRLLPRIIVAAILVNVSYWICAIAVDLSNIAGNSVYDIMIAIKDDLVGSETTAGPTSWKSLTGAILAGGTAAGAVGVGVAVTLASAGGSVMLLLPILLGVVIAVLVAIMVLAARQAIIIILIIIAPLAFVAYLLPNTEKLFEKWRGLFTTMMLLFPLFAGVMGGAQVAGEAIIQSAIAMDDDVVKLNLIIFGMGVKVAPVVVTPFLLKFSGSLLGKIAGVVNNPGKGLIDRTRNWSQEKADAYKAKQLQNKNPGFLARQAQRIDHNKRKRDGWKKAYEERANANWANSSDYRKIHGHSADSELIKQTGENTANAHVAAQRATNAAAQDLDIQARASKLQLDVSQARVDANWEEIKAGEGSIISAHGLAGNALRSYVKSQFGDISENAISSQVEARRAVEAQNYQKNRYAQRMVDDAALQAHAGGINGQLGADSALADAVKHKRSTYADSVKDAEELIKHFNIDGKHRQLLAMGNDVDVKDSSGNVIRTLSKNSDYLREAAIEMQLSGKGNYENIEEIIANSGGSLSKYATTISDAVPKYKLADKAPFLGGKTIDAISQGKISNTTELATAMATSIAGGKLKADHLVSMDQDALKSIVSKVAGKTGAELGISDPETIAKFEHYAHELGNLAHEALTDKRLSARLAGGAEAHLKQLESLYPPGSASPPLPPPDYTT